MIMYFVVLLNTLFCISHFTRSYFHFHDSSHGAWRARLHFTFQFSVHLSLRLSVSILTTSHLIFHYHFFCPSLAFWRQFLVKKVSLPASFLYCNGLFYEGVQLAVSLVIPSLTITYFIALLITFLFIFSFYSLVFPFS